MAERPGPPSLEVPTAPVRGRRGARRAAWSAGALVAGGIATAVAAAWLAPPPPVRPEPASGGSPAATPRAATSRGARAAAGTPSSAPSPSTGPRRGPTVASVLAGVPPRLSREDLRDAVREGRLDGRLVFVDGALQVTRVRCQSLAQGTGGCVDLAVPGLGLPVWAGATALPWRRDPPAGAWLVTVARANGLVYLGSLVPAPSGRLPIANLTERLLAGTLAGRDGTLFEVEGWLMGGGPGTVWMADREPDPHAPAGTAPPGAAVEAPAWLVDVEPGPAVTRGTFLVTTPEPCDPADARATCPADGLRWWVVARYEPSRSVRVVTP